MGAEMMGEKGPDGFLIVTYLRDEKTAELLCSSFIEAEKLLTALTIDRSSAVISTSDGERIIDDALIAYDRAEMWIDGSLVALGLNPSDNR